MGRRSSFIRRKNDAYFTPYKAIPPLLPHLRQNVAFVEPCAGDGRLVRHLERHGHMCVFKSDIAPQSNDIIISDCMEAAIYRKPLPAGMVTITNPAWTRELLHPMIERFRKCGPTWLLFDAGWAYTLQAKPYLKYCSKIVATPRLKWIEGSKHDAIEDAVWYCFGDEEVDTVFYGR